MFKDFDLWNQKKKGLDAKKDPPFFKEGEVWWINFGLNVGFEMNGKGSDFIRPVLIIKKYNQYSFLALPLGTSTKLNKYRVNIGVIDNKNAIANLSQIKNVDSKRLVNKICYLGHDKLLKIKEKTSQVNFS